MKKICKFMVVFSFLFLLISCENESMTENNSNGNEIVNKKTDEEIQNENNKLINDNYDMKLTYTIKPTANTYTYKFVYDCRIQIKAKSTSSKSANLKITIYDGEVDAFSEVILIRFYSLNGNTNIDSTISNVYTNNLLFAYSNKAESTNSIGTDFTKNFLENKTIYINTNGGDYKFKTTQTVNIVNNVIYSPTKNGYYFDGWYLDADFKKKHVNFDDLIDGMTIYAKWSPASYSINYKVSDDTDNSANTISSYTIEDDEIVLGEPSKKGYTFKGWYSNKNLSGEPISKIDKGSFGELDFYPKWEANTYDVELVFNDGLTDNVTISEVYDCNYSNLPIPKKEGFVFEGWFLDESNYDNCVLSVENGVAISEKVSVPNNHKLFARWVEGTNELIYEKYSSGYKITGCTNAEINTLKIPDSIAGVDVTAISKEAFKDMIKLNSIVLPNNLLYIGSSAFYNCTGITEINMPNSITYIGDKAFYNCVEVNKIHISENCENIGALAFAGMTKLKNIVIPDSVEYFGAKILRDCKQLESLSIPFVYGDSGEHYLGTMFGYFDSYKDLYIVQSNSYCVPKSLKRVTITKATKINDNTFAYLTNLEIINISKSVSSIGGFAFYNCTGLKYVNFDGTLEEWKSLMKNSSDNPIQYGAKLCVFENGSYVEVNNG